MSKLSITFHNTVHETAVGRRMDKSGNIRREGGSSSVKMALLIGLVCIGGYMLLHSFQKNSAPKCIIPKWIEVKPDSKEYAEAVRLVDKIVDVMKREGPGGLKKMWSYRVPSESLGDHEHTLSLYKGGELNVQSVRKHDEASKEFNIICKSSANGHRLRISFRMEKGVPKLSGVDMTP